MDFNIESNLKNKYIKNKYEFIEIHTHFNFYELELFYLDKNLLYVKIYNKNENPWDEDLKIRIYSLDNSNYEDLSIGGSSYYEKEMEFYLEINLEYKSQIIRQHIPNHIILNKKFNISSKKDYYKLKNFTYMNNFYLIDNDISIIENFIENNYSEIRSSVEYIINFDIKLIIYVLLYLNKNGGIFINHNLKNINIDEINIDNNLVYLNDNIISIIFSKINFLNEDLLLNDLNKKKKINFTNYLNDFVIYNDKPVIENKIKETKYDYYSDIFKFEKYNFYLLSKKDVNYTMEELQGDYYCLNTEDKIESDLLIEILNNETQEKIDFHERFIKNKFENNYIFKVIK